MHMLAARLKGSVDNPRVDDAHVPLVVLASAAVHALQRLDVIGKHCSWQRPAADTAPWSMRGM